MRAIVPLEDLPAGQPACIRCIRGRADHVHRLEEFGLRDGVMIRMFRPGNPCIIHLDGNKVCLRADRRLQIFVEPVHAAHERVAPRAPQADGCEPLAGVLVEAANV